MLKLIGSLITGAIVGWIAGKIMNTESSLLRNIVVGIIGSFVGSFVFGLLGFYAFGWVANLRCWSMYFHLAGKKTFWLRLI